MCEITQHAFSVGKSTKNVFSTVLFKSTQNLILGSWVRKKTGFFRYSSVDKVSRKQLILLLRIFRNSLPVSAFMHRLSCALTCKISLLAKKRTNIGCLSELLKNCDCVIWYEGYLVNYKICVFLHNLHWAVWSVMVAKEKYDLEVH